MKGYDPMESTPIALSRSQSDRSRGSSCQYSNDEGSPAKSTTEETFPHLETTSSTERLTSSYLVMSALVLMASKPDFVSSSTIRPAFRTELSVEPEKCMATFAPSFAN